MVAGTAFGSQGEGYVRVTYACSDDDIDEGMKRMREGPTFPSGDGDPGFGVFSGRGDGLFPLLGSSGDGNRFFPDGIRLRL